MVATTMKAFALVASVAATNVVAYGPPSGPPPSGPPPSGPPPSGPPPSGPPPSGPPPSDEVTHWGDWPAGCTPVKFEPYVCDDDYGKEYTTTYTEYPHDCTLWYEKPTPTPKTWAPWSTTKVEDPKTWATWTTEEDPKTWATWSTKKVEDPKTWYEWTTKEYDPPAPTWAPYHPYPPKPTDPAKWAEWEVEKKVVIITIIESYDVPCSTGWAKETTTIYTTHCGCEETPVPVHPPYATYTTECPEAWGVGKTVTYTVPAPTYTPKPADYTWLEWYTSTVTPVEPVKATTWAEYTPVTPVKDATWSTWATSVAVVAKPTGWSPVASWTGAASSSAVSKVMVAAAGAVAGLALFL